MEENMEDQTPDLKSLNTRLQKLEAQNLRMKKIGIVTILFASVIVLSGQAKTGSISKVVEANEFRLIDAKGRSRASLEMLGNQAELSIKDPDGQPDVLLGTDTKGAFLVFGDPEGKVGMALNPGSFSLRGSAGKLSVDLDDISAPSLTLEDNEGYSTVLGRSNLVLTATGKQEQTPAASLVLFDKNKKVLWSAP